MKAGDKVYDEEGNTYLVVAMPTDWYYKERNFKEVPSTPGVVITPVNKAERLANLKLRWTFQKELTMDKPLKFKVGDIVVCISEDKNLRYEEGISSFLQGLKRNKTNQITYISLEDNAIGIDNGLEWVYNPDNFRLANETEKEIYDLEQKLNKLKATLL